MASILQLYYICYVYTLACQKIASVANVICLWKPTLNNVSYMSAHFLLNLLNELGKRDKMRGLPSILTLFRNEFNKFNIKRVGQKR